MIPVVLDKPMHPEEHEIRDRVADLTARLGRPPRILHIGNIANNGFNNARVQRRYGLHADVLSADYYHVMATPEWEEADVSKRPADDFFPDWWALGLGGYQRPRWFASAPFDLACSYLEAWASGEAREAERRWQRMEHARFVLCSRTPGARLWKVAGKVVPKLRYEWKKMRQRVGWVSDPVSAPEGACDLPALRALWTQRRGERPFPAMTDDFASYWARFPAMQKLLPHYDVVQGYAQDGIWALLGGRAYAAYEHGTLRSLPFEDHQVGRLVALVYGLADEVFVTNSDVLPSVERLGLEEARVHPLPHAFDDQVLRKWCHDNRDIAPPAGPPLLFSPTRQHWVDGDPSFVKGNDIMLRAAGRLWREGRRFRLSLVEWGRDVAATRDLIRDLGFAEAVTWVPPMGKKDLWRAYRGSHAVLDQFVLPALGGVAFETLTLGRRLVTRIDTPTLARFFGEAPPVLPAGTEDEIAASLARIIDDPDDRAGIGEASAGWVDTYHSARRIVAIQVRAYDRLLAAQEA